jgi:hypothetical protein
MSYDWETTLNSVNSYVEKLEDDVNVTIAVFDSWTDGPNQEPLQFKVLREGAALGLKPIKETEVSARGGTPLYDAAAKMMNKMIEEDPAKAVLVIMTDGQENTSKEYKLADVKAKLAQIEKKGWPAVYLGANFKEVRSYSTSTFDWSAGATLNTTSATRGATMDLMAQKSHSYFTAPAGMGAESLNFTDQEIASAEGTNEVIKNLKVTTKVKTRGN